MRLIHIGVASTRTKVGAVRSNVDAALRLCGQMEAAGVTLAVLPEQVIGGYPPEDLIQWKTFVDAQWLELERFAAATAAHGCVYALGLTVAHEAHRYNS